MITQDQCNAKDESQEDQKRRVAKKLHHDKKENHCKGGLKTTTFIFDCHLLRWRTIVDGKTEVAAAIPVRNRTQRSFGAPLNAMVGTRLSPPHRVSLEVKGACSISLLRVPGDQNFDVSIKTSGLKGLLSPKEA